ncbi:LpxL/LpxP family acyltransferase [Thalassotalea ganghwensis]
MHNSATHWSDKQERGFRFGLKFLLASYRILGRRLLWLVLFPVVLCLFLTGKDARRSSRMFFNLAHQRSANVPKANTWVTLKHFCSFADSAFDKLDAWLGKITPQQISYDNYQAFAELVEKKQGAIFIGSHLGNLEVCRALSYGKYNTVINVLVFTANAAKFNEILQSISDDVSVNLIQVTDISPALAMTLKDKIDQGEMLVIVGDRTSITQAGRVEYVPFLGQKAPFSQGPFILASLLDCPVFWLFCFKEKQGFHLVFEKVAEQIRFKRPEREQGIKKLITAYAQRLEYYALKYPFQWFNFFNFWQKDDEMVRRIDKV